MHIHGTPRDSGLYRVTMGSRKSEYLHDMKLVETFEFCSRYLIQLFSYNRNKIIYHENFETAVGTCI